MQLHNAVDCPVEPHLLPIMVKVKTILTILTMPAWKPASILSGLAWCVEVNKDDDEDELNIIVLHKNKASVISTK